MFDFGPPQDLTIVNPRIPFDLRYRDSKLNPLGISPYSETFKPYLRKQAARALSDVDSLLHDHGYRLLIWDAWRPLHACLEVILNAPVGLAAPLIIDEDMNILSISNHYHGTAIDVTLISHDGRSLQMPTDFDILNDQTSSSAEILDLRILERRILLSQTMEKCGWIQNPDEWWHFDFNF